MEIFNDFERLNTIVSGVSDTVFVGNTVDVSASTLIPISGSFVSSPTDIQFNGTKVTISNPLPVSGNFGMTFPNIIGVSGEVDVNNFPLNQLVTLSNPISGDISILNFPYEQNITGIVSVSSIPNVTISNPQTIVGVSGIVNSSINNIVGISANSPISIINSATQSISGSVSILNPVSVVSVSSIPNVTIANPQTTVGISGTPAISISNFPSTQIISADVAIPVSGTISAFPMDLQFDGTLVSSGNPLPITGNVTTIISDTISVSADIPLSTNLTSNSVAYWPAQTFVQP